MFDMSWGEIMVIGAVALIVIGPRDLPKALRTVGNMTGKIRRMASEFQGQFAEAMREAELDDVRKQLQGMNDSVSSLNPIQTIRDELKSAVEGGEAPRRDASSSTETVAQDSVQAPGETSPSVPAEPQVAIPSDAVPPIADPAESVSIAVNQAADARENAGDEPTKRVERAE
jgi:sec-independent protein translocase protein TatB